MSQYPIKSFPVPVIQRGRKYLFSFQGYDPDGNVMSHGATNVIDPRIYFRDVATRHLDLIAYPFTNESGLRFQMLPGASIPKQFSNILDNPFMFYLDPNLTRCLCKPQYVAELVIAAVLSNDQISTITLSSNIINVITQLNPT